jgi:hypothetical protein
LIVQITSNFVALDIEHYLAAIAILIEKLRLALGKHEALPLQIDVVSSELK